MRRSLPSKKSILSLSAAVTVALSGCVSEEKTTGSGEQFHESVNVADSLGVKDGEAQVFLLPAPLQVATRLRNEGIPYRAGVLAKINHPTTYSSNMQRALILGIYAIDLGQAATNEDYPTCIKYAGAMETILKDMQVNIAEKNNLAERFEKLVGVQDSLFALINEAYKHLFDYLQRNEQEGLGLLTLVGCYVEGLYLAAESTNGLQSAITRQIVIDQNRYMDNVLKLLQFYYDHITSESLVSVMKNLRKAFEDAGFGEEKRVMDINEEDLELNKVRLMIGAIRDELING